MDIAALLILSGIAYLLTCAAGERGFFAFDQSIVFDGGYRILSGQVPYRDFILPIGPMAFLLQAMCFRIWGIHYFACIAGAAVCNVLATLLSVLLVRLLFPGRRRLSYVAGALTAVWFYPPFGILYTEQTAFLCALAALVCLVAALRSTHTPRLRHRMLLVASGMLVALSVLSKQNAGCLFIPACLALILATAPDRRRVVPSCALWCAGALAVALTFTLWLMTSSNVARFLRYTLHVPSAFAWHDRLLKRNVWKLLKSVIFGVGPHLFRPMVLLCLVASLVVIWRCIRQAPKDRDHARPQLLASLLGLALVLIEHLFTYTALNQSENGWPFIGVITALGLGLSMDVLRRSWARRAAVVSVSAMSLLIAGAGLHAALHRTVQDIFRDATFPAYLTYPTLRALRWGEPTRLEGTDITAQDVEALLRYVASRRVHFFVFPHWTILYGLVGVPSPQPLLWVHPGLTYPEVYDESLDRWIVSDLQRNDVRIVILEGAASGGVDTTRRRLHDFPLLQRYIEKTFVLRQRIGMFAIYEQAGARVR